MARITKAEKDAAAKAEAEAKAVADAAATLAAARLKATDALGTPVARLSEHESSANVTTMDLKREIGSTIWSGYRTLAVALGEKDPTDADQTSDNIWSDICKAYAFDRKPGAGKVSMLGGKVRRGVSTLSEDFDTFRYWSHYEAAKAEATEADESLSPNVLLPRMRRLGGAKASNRAATESVASALSALGAALTDDGITLDAAKAASADDAKVRTKAWDALGDSWQDMFASYSDKIAASDVATLRAVARVFSAAADEKAKAAKAAKAAAPAGATAESIAIDEAAKDAPAGVDIAAIVAAAVAQALAASKAAA